MQRYSPISSKNYEIKLQPRISKKLSKTCSAEPWNKCWRELDAHLGYDRHENVKPNDQPPKRIQRQDGTQSTWRTRNRYPARPGEASLNPNSSQSIRRMFCRLKTACRRCMRKGNPNGISPLPFRTSTASISATKPFLSITERTVPLSPGV